MVLADIIMKNTASMSGLVETCKCGTESFDCIDAVRCNRITGRKPEHGRTL